MAAPPRPEVEVLDRGDYVETRYLGAYTTLDAFKQRMARSARACAEAGKGLLLVNIVDLQNYNPPTLERHEIGVAGAQLSRGLEKVAVIGKREQLGDAYATTVARNRGLAVQVFVDRDEALRWLLSGPGSRAAGDPARREDDPSPTAPA